MKLFRFFLIATGLIGILVFQNFANSKPENVDLSSNAGGTRLLYDKNGESCQYGCGNLVCDVDL